jgi:transcription-repair coupling factor (superfamily II helicase)
VQDCTIDTDLEILIPDEYVESITERLTLYTRLDNSENEAELKEFAVELEDRFGPVPQQVADLLDTIRSRRIAVELGFEKMMLKNEVLRCYFISRPDSPYFESDLFRRILQYIQTETNKAKLKQVGKLFVLQINDIKSMQEMLVFLKRMHEWVVGKMQNAKVKM